MFNEDNKNQKKLKINEIGEKLTSEPNYKLISEDKTISVVPSLKTIKMIPGQELPPKFPTLDIVSAKPYVFIFPDVLPRTHDFQIVSLH